MKKNSDAFTTIEIMLVVTLIAIVISGTAGIYFMSKRDNDLDVTQNILIQYLRRAQSFSKGSRMDSSWGVSVRENKIIIFKGEDYESSDSDYEEVYSYPSSISITGIEEIYFNKVNGIPSTTGEIRISDISNRENVIFINKYGYVDY